MYDHYMIWLMAFMFLLIILPTTIIMIVMMMVVVEHAISLSSLGKRVGRIEVDSKLFNFYLGSCYSGMYGKFSLNNFEFLLEQ
jgi:hypothetical protein